MLTKQGVKDLNGPAMRGSGYNGSKTATCPHHRAPDTVPTHETSRIVRVEAKDGVPEDYKRAFFVCCSNCGSELYEKP